MKYLGLIIMMSMLLACSEQECCVTPEEPTMVGSWKLTKLCFSNGASSCNEEDMWDADTDETITFTQTDFTFNREGELCSGTYERVGDMDVKLTATGGNCNFDETTYIITRLTVTEMMFSPLCIEGCPHLYTKQ